MNTLRILKVNKGLIIWRISARAEIYVDYMRFSFRAENLIIYFQARLKILAPNKWRQTRF